MIKVSITGKGPLEKAIRDIAKSNENPGREFQLIARRMLKMQRQHFKDQKGPTGQAWPGLSPATLIARREKAEKGSMRMIRGEFKARGLSTRGLTGVLREEASRMVSATGMPLLRDTARLINSLTTKSSPTEAIVGTNVKYAATHQFGDKRRKIPARPYLYLNTTEGKELTRMITYPLILVHLKKQGGGAAMGAAEDLIK